MEKKLAFDSFLNSQQQYRGDKTYVDEDGIQHYAGTPLYSSTPNFFGQSVKRNPVNIDIANYQSGQNNQGDSVTNFINQLKAADPNISGDVLSKAVSAFLLKTTPKQKLGGKFRYIK